MGYYENMFLIHQTKTCQFECFSQKNVSRTRQTHDAIGRVFRRKMVQVQTSFAPIFASLLLALFLCTGQATAQNSWVYFTDKCHDDLRLDDAVCIDYLDYIKNQGVEVVGTSKWLNAACVKGNPKHLMLATFVDRVEALGRYKVIKHEVQQTQEEFSYGHSDWQLNMLGLDSFHRLGYTGKGVTIALFDGGFYKADTVHAFDSLWDQGRIKGYWDFLRDDTTNFWEYDGHGKYVLSIIAANWPDSMMGAAPGANYLLARTEHTDKEVHLEEYAWVKGLEWADSMGADIIHSSLGYSEFDTLEGDYTYADMDGETTIITKATDIAFSKGIFVTNSAGNDGDDEWHYITAPCDGKHVLCVGSVDSNRNHSVFSSYGPSADGRVKPDVMAMGEGVTFIDNKATLKTGNGTSFSGPIIAGFVACLKQAWPDMTNVQIYEAVIQSADRYQNPDTAYGYGLPNILKADSLLAQFVSVAELKARQVNIYPNPVESLVNVITNTPIEAIRIVDMAGNTLYAHTTDNERRISVDLSEFAQGVYVLVIRLEGGLVEMKKLEKI